MEPRNRFQGINSGSLCSLAGRYDNPIPTRFLSPKDCLKIPAQHSRMYRAGTVSGRFKQLNFSHSSSLRIQIHRFWIRIQENGPPGRKKDEINDEKSGHFLRLWRLLPEFDIPSMMNYFFVQNYCQFSVFKNLGMKFRCIESESKTAMLTTFYHSVNVRKHTTLTYKK
jgi:hypothetical protein